MHSFVHGISGAVHQSVDLDTKIFDKAEQQRTWHTRWVA